MRRPRKILYDFAQTTTAHGFSQVANSKNIIQKLFWIVLVTGCNLYIILNTITFIDTYNRKSTSTNVYLRKEMSSIFPVVVLCNVNIINSAKRDEILREINEMNRMKGQNISAKINFRTITELQLSIGDRIFNYSTMFDRFFISCKLFHFKNCKEERYWEKIWHPHYGTCFAFNDDRYKNGSIKQLEMISEVGILSPLELVLNISQGLYYDLDVDAGVRLYLGDQGSFYQPLKKGYNLSPGFSYVLPFRKQKVFRVDPFNSNTCMKHHTVKFYSQEQSLVTKYDTNLCSYDCIASIMIKYCNCTNFELPYMYPNIPICDRPNICKANIQNNNSKEIIGCLKKCQPPCEETNYLGDLTFLQFPNLINKNKYGESFSLIRENLIRVQMFFNSMNVEVWEERVIYNFENLLADIGGQLGLLSGISIITLFEFIYVMFLLAKHFTKKESCITSKSPEENLPDL